MQERYGNGFRGSAAEGDLVALNQLAFETGVEMQMVMLETASRLAEECTASALRHAEASAADAVDWMGAASPAQLLRLQQRGMMRMLGGFAEDAGRFAKVAGRAAKDSAEAVKVVAR